MVLGAVLCLVFRAFKAPLFSLDTAGMGASTKEFQDPQAEQRPAHFKVSLPHSVQ
jgi:hypothetical protein